MSKKLLIGLAPLVVIASFVMMPAAAQALAPHWYVDGVKAEEGVKVPVIAWGQLTLEPEPIGVAASTTCENAAGGFLENPSGGGPGKGQTSRFSTWNCTNAECPPGEIAPGVFKEFEVVSPPQSLPWPNELINAAAPFRLNSTGVKVELGCVAHPVTKAPAGSPGENEQKPLAAFVPCKTDATHLQDPTAKNGTNKGNNQSTLVFDQPAGSGLICTVAAGSITGHTSQFLKSMGYGGSELITVKNS